MIYSLLFLLAIMAITLGIVWFLFCVLFLLPANHMFERNYKAACDHWQAYDLAHRDTVKAHEEEYWRTYAMNHEYPFLCFPSSTTLVQGEQRFIQKYGIKPEQSFYEFNLLWVGPVPKTPAPEIKPEILSVDLEQMELDL